jgi:hypothetical protein
MKQNLTHKISDNFFSKKWLVILISAIILTVFGRVIDNKSLTQSGIVVGIGIDYQQDKYEVTVQTVSVSGSAGTDKTSSNYLTYSATGSTLTEAINSISEKLGLIVSLSHCNLVIMSRSALELNPVRTFSALTKPLALPEQALVVATDHNIPKLFASKIPSTENISFFLQAVLLQDLEAGGLTSVSVKDYLAMRCSRSGSAIVPFLTLTEMEEKPIGDNSSGQDKNYIVDINQNLVLDNKSNLLINENIASAVNLFYSTKVKNKLPSRLDEGVIEFRIVNNSRSIKIDGNTILAKIKMNVSFVEAQGLDTPYILNCNSPEVLKAKDALEKQLTNALMEGYQLSKSSGIDFLGIKNLLHQKYGLTLDDKGFDKADFKVEFDIEVTENS